MSIALISFLILSSWAAPKLGAKLPTYTPNNPHGIWANLPRGSNYIFCGDRILFGSDFNKKIKVIYENQTREMSLREHCELRRRTIEQAYQNKTAEEPTLVELQYNKIQSILKKIPAKKNRSAYSLNELRRAMGARELNALRAANLMLPALSHSEFAQTYVGSSNNPRFIDTEYERYTTNLLTQNPAMLYTAEGKLYYFSMNLSEDQLRLLGSVLSSGGSSGGGMRGGSGGSGGGGQKRGLASNQANEPDGPSRSDVAKALEANRKNPFDGYMSGNKGLQVKPQATTLPDHLNIHSNATFVPYNVNLSNVSMSRTSQGASDSSPVTKGSSSRPVVAVSSSPSLSMIPNVSGVRRGNTASGSSSSGGYIGGGTNSQSSGGSANAPSGSVSPASGSLGAAPTNAKLSGVASPASVDSKAAYRMGDTASAEVTGRGILAGVTDAAGPYPIKFNGNDHIANLSCQANAWASLLDNINNDVFIESENNPDSCYPVTENTNYESGSTDPEKIYRTSLLSSKFCSKGDAGEKYTRECVYTKDEKITESSIVKSCYDQIMVDVGTICASYFDMKAEYNYKALMECAENLFTIACDKVPCDLDRSQASLTVAGVIDEVFESSGGGAIVEVGVSPLASSDISEKILKPASKIIKLPHLIKANLPVRGTGERISLLDSQTSEGLRTSSVITEEHWNKTRKTGEDFLEHLLQLTVFYKSNLSQKCNFEEKLYPVNDAAQ